MLAMRRRTVVLMATVGVVVLLGVGMALANTSSMEPSTYTTSTPQNPQIEFTLDDKIIGTNTANAIKAGPGDDLILAKGGNDTINAGPGNDKVYAGKGDDKIVIIDREVEVLVNCGLGFDEVFTETGNPQNSVSSASPGELTFDPIGEAQEIGPSCEQVVQKATGAGGG